MFFLSILMVVCNSTAPLESEAEASHTALAHENKYVTLDENAKPLNLDFHNIRTWQNQIETFLKAN